MLAFISRLILILVAISAIRSAIQFVQRMMGNSGVGPVVRRASPSPGRAGATLLQQDPVCGAYVAADISLKRIVRGKVVHFCSTECRDRYQAG